MGQGSSLAGACLHPGSIPAHLQRSRQRHQACGPFRSHQQGLVEAGRGRHHCAAGPGTPRRQAAGWGGPGGGGGGGRRRLPPADQLPSALRLRCSCHACKVLGPRACGVAKGCGRPGGGGGSEEAFPGAQHHAVIANLPLQGLQAAQGRCSRAWTIGQRCKVLGPPCGFGSPPIARSRSPGVCASYIVSSRPPRHSWALSCSRPPAGSQAATMSGTAEVEAPPPEQQNGLPEAAAEPAASAEAQPADQQEDAEPWRRRYAPTAPGAGDRLVWPLRGHPSPPALPPALNPLPVHSCDCTHPVPAAAPAAAPGLAAPPAAATAVLARAANAVQPRAAAGCGLCACRARPRHRPSRCWSRRWTPTAPR